MNGRNIINDFIGEVICMENKLAGFPEYQRAIAKVHLGSCGADQKKLDRPIIAVVNSWNELVTGHVHLRTIADQVKKSILAAGGVPLEFNTIAICDGIAQGHAGMKYVLASRELIADSIEAMVCGHGMFDGMVLLGSCDKIVPGMLMSAARLNLPSMMITGGPMQHRITPTENKAARQKYIHGEISEEELLKISGEYYTEAGVCPFLGTANTMCIVAEALGMTLPGVSTVPALSEAQEALVAATGRRIVELVREGIRPRDIMTKDAFENAITATLAIGGSLNAVLHIPAIASECGISLSLHDFDTISRRTPLTTRVCPNSGEYATADLYPVGGAPAILRGLGDLLHEDAKTVSGYAIKENVRNAPLPDGTIIRPADDPFEPEGGIAVLKGSLAPNGAVVKSSAVPADLWKFEGPAIVFDSEEDCQEAAYAKKIAPGAAVVIRYEGPGGGPGMREMHRSTEILAKIPGIAIITDGRFSGASAGLSVGYLSPEAQAGGPIALVENGDKIRIDIAARRIDLCVDEATLQARHQSFAPPQIEVESNFLRMYRATVQDAYHGAIRKTIR